MTVKFSIKRSTSGLIGLAYCALSIQAVLCADLDISTYPPDWPKIKSRNNEERCKSFSGIYNYYGEIMSLTGEELIEAPSFDNSIFRLPPIKGNPVSVKVNYDEKNSILVGSIQGKNLSPKERVDFELTLRCESGILNDSTSHDYSSDGTRVDSVFSTYILTAEDSSIVVYRKYTVKIRYLLVFSRKTEREFWLRFDKRIEG